MIGSPADRRCRPQLEQLEAREVLSAYDPTAVEQVFLERLNDARANPAAYGQSIGVDLSNVAPSEPLALDPLLMQAAVLHSQDMNAQNYFSHTTPSGVGPDGRIAATGFVATGWGESIAAGYATPEAALQGLITDAGVPDLGHRRQLLAIDASYRGLNLAGVGIVLGGTGTYQDYYTIDTASNADTRPYLTGVVYSDANHNGLYDAGEGLGGVTVTVQGVGATTTFSTGGYSLQLNPGTYTVTFSGGTLTAPVTRTVSVGAVNYRLTIAADSTSTPAPASTTTPPTSSPGGTATPSGTATPVATPGTTNTTPTPTTTPSWPTPSSDPSQAWLFNVYEGLLNRAPGQGDYAFWLGVVQQGATHDDVVAAIMQSSEYDIKYGAKWLPQVYQTMLGRAPGTADFNYWLGVLGSGVSQDVVVANIAMSAEYQQSTGGQASAWLDKIYQNVLNRHTRPVDQSYWLGVLATGASYAEVAVQIMQSQEYQLAQDGVWLGQVYQSFLGHAPSSSDVAFWLTLIQEGATRAGIVDAVLASAEFNHRVTGK
jgi:uncharacterized protein YkwD